MIDNNLISNCYFQMYEKNDFHFLEVLNVTQEDKGEFTCVITNSKGNVSHSIDLDVYSKLLLRAILIKSNFSFW